MDLPYDEREKRLQDALKKKKKKEYDKKRYINMSKKLRDEIRERQRDRNQKRTEKQKEKIKEYRKEYREKMKFKKEVTKLLQSIDNGGAPSVITNNLRKISKKLDVEIYKSDKPIDVINNIRLTLDTKEDFQNLLKIYESLKIKGHINFYKILDYFKKNEKFFTLMVRNILENKKDNIFK